MLCEDISVVSASVVISNESSNEINCVTCNLTFANNQEFEAHVVETHELNSEKHSCTKCNNGYRNTDDLSSHILSDHPVTQMIQAEEVEVKCRKCPFKTLNLLKLDEHMKAKHGKNKSETSSDEDSLCVEFTCGSAQRCGSDLI